MTDRNDFQAAAEAKTLPEKAFKISPEAQKEIRRRREIQNRLRKRYAKIPIGGKLPIGVREKIFNLLCRLFRVRAR